MSIHKDIRAYNASQSAADKRICGTLAKTIEEGLPGAENKIWHRHPVWFLDGNPIVGYHKLKDCVRLLFWSGQSFDEPGLSPEGSFKAAEARYTSQSQISVADLQRWLKKGNAIQWDYKNTVKRKGKLERLTRGPKNPESGDWQSGLLARVRTLIQQADPEVVEEVKWRKPSNGMRGVPVWSHNGIICTGEIYKKVVKLTFAKGAALADPAGLFNSSLDGNTRRAIDIQNGNKIDEEALQALVQAAVELNTAGKSKSAVRTAKKPKGASPPKKSSTRKRASKPT